MSQPGGKKGGTGKGPPKDKNDDNKETKNGKPCTSRYKIHFICSYNTDYIIP